jgi:hypothetical protein
VSELAHDLNAARKELARLSKAADRKRSGGMCRKGQHIRRCRQSVAAISGHEAFRERIRDITGHELVHAGYHLYECIACGQWSVDDYCGDPSGLPVSADAAAELR